MDDELFTCPNDGTVLHQNWQNTGFTPPDGAPHYEVESWYCPVCKFSTAYPEDLEGEDDTEE